MKPGHLLTPEDQASALRLYVYRHTRDHKPRWVYSPRPDGRPYAVQFASDDEWLVNTLFPVTKEGRLKKRGDCHSTPTWPDNPELRPKD